MLRLIAPGGIDPMKLKKNASIKARIAAAIQVWINL
jgi:hypothetical protein